MPFMRNKTFFREPAKIKAELREVLAEAIRNMKPEPELLDPHPPKTWKARG